MAYTVTVHVTLDFPEAGDSDTARMLAKGVIENIPELEGAPTYFCDPQETED